MNWLKRPLKARHDNWTQSYWSSTYFWKEDGEHIRCFTVQRFVYLQCWWYVCNDGKCCSYSLSSRPHVMVKLASSMLVQANTLVVLRSNANTDTCIMASHVLRPFSPLCFLFMTGFTRRCLADVLRNVCHLVMTAQKITTNNLLQLASFFFPALSSAYRRWHLHKILK